MQRAGRRSVTARWAIVMAAAGSSLLQAMAAPAPAAEPPQAAVAEGKRFGLALVPADAAMVIALRPTALLREPALSKLADAFKDDPAKGLGIAVDHIEELTLAYSATELSLAEPMAVVVQLKEPGDSLALLKEYFSDSLERQHHGQKYRQSRAGSAAWLLPGTRTLVMAQSESILHKLIDAGGAGAVAADRAVPWNQASGRQAAFFVKTGLLRDALKDGLSSDLAIAFLSAFIAPLWQNTDTISLGLTVDANARFSAAIDTASPADAKKTADTLSAVALLCSNFLSQMGAKVAEELGEKCVDDVLSLLTTLKVEVDQSRIQLSGSAPAEGLAPLFAATLPGIVRGIAEERMERPKQHLKQLALAMHNYHDIHGHFPPAVLYGADNKGGSPHGHSWRVALLPLLDQEALYAQYKFDEPWDSPANRQVLEQMPAVFRDLREPADSLNSSYFAIVGEGTPFSDKDGTAIGAITDGTSNTLMFVEAIRDIPWTKPEDIPYVADKRVPEFGGHHTGGFLAAYCDGAVHQISPRTSEKTLRLLITQSDGEPVDPNEHPN